MNLIGLTICRNSGWCLPATARAALRWCDGLVIHDHASTDDTPAAIAALTDEYPGRIIHLRDHDPTWREAAHRQRTLEAARAAGATHMAIVDDDECLTENLIPLIREQIESLNAGEVLQIPWIMLWRSLDAYRSDDCNWSRSMVSMAFRDDPGRLRWQTRDGYDFHHRHPFESTARQVGQLHEGGMLHFQHANWKRLCWKQVLYRVVEQLRWPHFGNAAIEAKYAGTTDETGLITTPVPAHWWGPERKLIDIDRTPWQEAVVRDLLSRDDRERFAGLNFLGLI
jgi:hypothetical protein